MKLQAGSDFEDVFPIERRQMILSVLREEGKVIAADLANRLKVSVDTIRRDLNQLAMEGLIQRVHGGGLPGSPALNPALERQFENQKSKEIIAEKAAQLVQNGSVVFLDSGTTAVQVAAAIRPEKEFTVITHNPRAALVLAEKGCRAEIILLGGRIDHHDLVAMSPSTITEVRKYRASLFLLGVCSIHPALGITCRTLEDLEVKRAMAEASAEVAGLATAEKLGTAGPMVLGPVSMLNHLVTDASEEFTREYAEAGVSIL
jgi:DeoR/GlpR family transcriptional regulator of sugar metabolism